MNKGLVRFSFAFMFVMLVGSGSVFGAEYVVNSSNYSTFIPTLSGEHTVRFEAGIYSGFITVNHPLTLVSDTGDYRTSGVVFTGESSVRVRSDNVSIKGFRFENVTSEMAYGDAAIVAQHGFANLLIEKNFFNNTDEKGFQVDGLVTTVPNFVNVSVVDNYFEKIGFNYNLTADRNKETAILFYSVNDSVIRDNVVNGTTWNGLNLHTVFNIVIENNTVYNTSKNGIQVAISPGANVNITGNTVMFANSDRTRIAKESYRLSKNVLGDAVRLENISLDGVNDGNSLVRMRDPNVKAAISIDAASDVRIENNVITNNHDGVIVCPSDCAISNYSYQYNDHGGLLNGTDAVIRNNIIHSNDGSDGGEWSGRGKDLISGAYNLTVNARYNYWGTNAPGPTIDGNITYDPWSVVNEMNERSAHDVDEIVENGSAVFNVSDDSDEASTVRNVELSVNETVENVTLVVAVADSRPSAVDRVSSSRKVYAYVEIEDSVDESIVKTNATITFVVSKRWLDSNNIKRGTGRLLRFSGGRWLDLNTNFINEVDDDVTFSAFAPGFSVFAITGVRTRSVSGGGGGGGGGGSGSDYIPAAGTFPWLFVDRQAVNAVQFLNPDEPFMFSTSARDVVLTSVVVNVNTAVRNAIIVAASLRSKPSSISSDPDGKVYRYVGIATDNVKKAYIDSITATFAVSREWMDENNAGNSNIALFIYDDASSSWVNAGVRKVNETDSEVLFEAETRGSEVFAIVSRGEKEAAAETPAEPEEPAAPTPPAVEVEETALPATGTAVLETDETETGILGGRGILSPVPLAIMAIIAVAIAVSVFAAYYKKKRA